MSYEVQQQRSLLYHPLAVGEDSLPDSKLVLPENGRYLGLSATMFRRLSSRLGLRTAYRRPASCLVTWNECVS
ncbi:hypothetical protein TNCV_4412471 [Trichonephila clavipes]|nr:hypothetical protein TNCV_4412471 [Trichonephila clavipes]